MIHQKKQLLAIIRTPEGKRIRILSRESKALAVYKPKGET